MARWICTGLLVLLVLLPPSARAEERPPNALEVGASIAACMEERGLLPSGESIEVHGTIHEVTLIYRVRPFAVLHRRDFDAGIDPWLAYQTSMPPMAFDMVGNNRTDAQRNKIVGDAGACYIQTPGLYPSP